MRELERHRIKEGEGVRATSIPSSFGSILSGFRGCFTHPSFENFVRLMAGWVLCPGRRTISRVIQASEAAKHHSTLYRFFSRARWSAGDLGERLFRFLLPWPPEEITVLIDDTLCHRGGPHLFGAGMHHDASRSTYGRRTSAGPTVQFAFGHNWVALAVWVPLPWHPSGGKALPLLFRLYRSKKRCPERDYRKRTDLAAELLQSLHRWLPAGRRLLVVGDAEYACRSVIRTLPESIHFVGPMCMDAALYAPARRRRQRGRKAIKGTRLLSPQKLAAQRGPWKRLAVTIYGRRTRILVKSQRCLWYTVAGARLGRMVLTRDPRGRISDRAYFCTDPDRSLQEILVAFSRRWEIEVAFREAKQSMGLEDPQNGWWRRPAGTRRPKKRAGPQPRGRRGELAIRHTFPFAFLAYGLVVSWYLRCGRPAHDVTIARRSASWYAQKHAPSFTNMLSALRRELWRARISSNPSLHRVRRNVQRLFQPWLLAA